MFLQCRSTNVQQQINGRSAIADATIAVGLRQKSAATLFAQRGGAQSLVM
jgi:hypothetical protein